MNSARNPYREEIDFAQLALQDEDFNKFLKPNGQINFSDPEAVRQLTISLLRRDFSLALSLPPDRLCPPVPNRLNYILWLQDLLDDTTPVTADSASLGLGATVAADASSAPVVGLDVGTGASAIYPLLGCALRSRWHFLATDIDATNLAAARHNVATNGLETRIRVLARTPEQPLVPSEELLRDEVGMAEVAFVMTNPPFFADQAELEAGARAKGRPPGSACTGAPVEMVYGGGGEVAFVGRLVDESSPYRANNGSGLGLCGRRVRWFSSMLGKLSSVEPVVSRLRAAGCANWAVADFVQAGGRTRRWAVAWSWRAWRPPAHVARASTAVDKALLPFPSEASICLQPTGAGGDAKAVGASVDAKMSELDVRWQWNADTMTGVAFAKRNVWSRSARRKKGKRSQEKDGHVAAAAGQEEDDVMEDDGEGEEPALGVRLQVKERRRLDGEKAQTEVHVRWLVGLDHVLFESFCGMLKRHLMGS